jgi:PAS domain S-box-containing protein
MSRNSRIVVGFAVALFLLGALGLGSYINTQRLVESNQGVVHTHEVLENLGIIQSVLTDAETGQRGFILTGREHYLQPYDHAVDAIQTRLHNLGQLTSDNRDQQADLDRLRALTDAKLAELGETIELRRKSGLDAALPVILTDRGKIIMDDIRALIEQMRTREQGLLKARQDAANTTARWTMWTLAGGIPLVLVLLAVAAVILMRYGSLGDAVTGPPHPESKGRWIVVRYGFALLAVVVATALRFWLVRYGPLPLFITYYPAVLLVALLAGGGPAIVATLLAALAADYWFLPPYGNFSISTPSDVLSLTIFTGSNLVLSVMGERLRRSRWAEAFGLAKQQEAEELARKNEELAQQSEELAQQSEEVARQNEELQAQSEEISTLNTELTGRENMLQKLLDATRLSGGEEAVLSDICAAARDLFGPAAAAVAVFETQADRLLVRAHAGLGAATPSRPLAGSFAAVVVQQGRTACLNDAALRPDLTLLQVDGAQPFRAALASPLRVAGQPFGLVSVYSDRKQEWTAEQFRLAEWLAVQCGHILETLRLQQQLRGTAERNRFLSEILEHSEQAFGVGYPDGRLGFTNGAFERLTGYSRQELEKIDWGTALTPAEWRPLESQKLAELARTGQPVRYEKEYLRKDGTRLPIELLVHMATDADGKVLYYYSFITDITERRQTEGARARLAAIVETTDDAILSKDTEGKVLTWNAAAERLFGYQAREIVGRSVALLLPADRLTEEDEILKKLRAGQRVDHLETVRLAKDGRPIMVSVTSSPILDAAGRFIGASKIVRDITEHKEAEERLRLQATALEAAANAIVITDARGAIQWVNPAFTRLTGYSAAEALGQNPRVLNSGRHDRAFFTNLWQTVTSGHVWQGEVTNKRKDGSLYQEEMTITPLADAGGKVTRFIAIKQDVTARKNAEEGLRQTAQELVRSNADLEKFAYVSSHDLQEPLRMVSGFLQLLAQKYAGRLDAQGDQYIHYAVDGAKRMQQLIGDLLAYSRIGRQPRGPEPTDTGKSLDLALVNLSVSINAAGAAVTHGELPTVSAEAGQLVQLFQNLIGNAVKFHGRQSPKVHVEARREGPMWVFSVADNGIGIEPPYRERIFEVFQRLHARNEYEGTGIGLAICKKIVDNHGGKIWVESQPGVGSTFLFTLPA